MLVLSPCRLPTVMLCLVLPCPCSPFLAARYHSLLVAKESCPEELEVTAWTEDGSIMAMVHKQYPHIQGVQFHPESILTSAGHRMIGNFIEQCALSRR